MTIEHEPVQFRDYSQIHDRFPGSRRPPGR
jgi:hypothetical protein